MSRHYRSYTDTGDETKSEEISDQIDRLNKALAEVMMEIEVSSCSRNHSRLSINQEVCAEAIYQTEESEDHIEERYAQTIEQLLHTVDRQQMIIEDFCSEEKRKVVGSPEKRERASCGHDLNRIRKEIWLQVKMQKNEQSERERVKFEQELVALDELKEDYYRKRSEILLGVEKLKIKEQLLEAKEKELRSLKLSFEKQKIDWGQEHGIQSKPDLLPVPRAIPHNRSNSFSPGSINSPSAPKVEPKPRHLPMEIQPDSFSPSKQDQLKQYQTELRDLETQSKSNSDPELAEHEMKIEYLRNKIAALRGEIAISESNKTTRLFSSVINSIQRVVNRDEKPKVSDKNEVVVKNTVSRVRNIGSHNLPVKPRPLDIKVEDYKKPSIDAPTPKGLLNPKREFDEIYMRKKALLDKEKELAQREAFLQQTWMKVPGGDQLIENVNMTLALIQNEKQMLEKDREEFNKERLNWVKGS